MTISYSDRVLLTIHGVISDNSALGALREECVTRLPGLIADNFSYEKVFPIWSLPSTTRQIIFNSIWLKIKSVWLEHLRGTDRKFFIVAHSFGTLGVIRALEMQIPEVKIDGLILFGSIVRNNQFWDGWVGGQLKSPAFAVIRPLDWVVRLGKRYDGGDSGAEGFVATGRFSPYQTYKAGGHTSYYPDDVDDVVEILRSGISSRALTSKEAWYSLHNGWRTRARIAVNKKLAWIP